MKTSIAPAVAGSNLAPEASSLKFPSDNPPDTNALAQAQRNASIQAATPQKLAKPTQFYVPSMWNIEPDGESIIATHTSLGEVFKGTPKEFSKMLRGE